MAIFVHNAYLAFNMKSAKALCLNKTHSVYQFDFKFFFTP